MDAESVKAFCLSLAGAVAQEYSDPSNILVMRVGDKKFAYFKTSEPERWRFSIRVSPEHFLELTDQPGIKPARYMGRFHWISIVDVSAVPERYLSSLIRSSYDRAIASLPKYKRDAIANLTGANV